MAAPLKRLCCQAARQTKLIRSHEVAESPLIEPSQWLKVRPLSTTTSIPVHFNHQQRHSYTTSTPKLAVRSRPSRQNQDEESTSTQEMKDDVPHDYLMDESQISSLAHGELDQHREIREMMRTAAWEMPLLTQLAKPFERQSRVRMPLRWRYTTYMGDSHPASRKVVVEFRIKDLLDLTEQQKLKLQKLVGPRLNPEKKTVRMSCDSFETQAQNKRFLGDTIQKLIAEVQDPEADTFEDVPLDTRHHKFKQQLVFPKEWRLTSERRAELESKRQELLLEEGKKVEDGHIVSGIAAIEAARQLKAEEQPVLVAANVNKKSPRGGRPMKN